MPVGQIIESYVCGFTSNLKRYIYQDNNNLWPDTEKVLLENSFHTAIHSPSTSSHIIATGNEVSAWQIIARKCGVKAQQRGPLNAADVTKNQRNTHPLWTWTTMHLLPGWRYDQLLRTTLAIVCRSVNSRVPVRRTNKWSAAAKGLQHSFLAQPSIHCGLAICVKHFAYNMLWLGGNVAIADSPPCSHKVRF